MALEALTLARHRVTVTVDLGSLDIDPIWR
jgi:hypothetical protein